MILFQSSNFRLLTVILHFFCRLCGCVANQASLSQHQHCSPDGVFGEAGAPHDHSRAKKPSLLHAGESLGSDDRLGPYTECEVAKGHVVGELPTDLRVLPPTVLGPQLWQEILGAAPSLFT